MHELHALVAAIALAFTVQPSHAETTAVGDNGFVVRHEAGVAADTMTVWTMLADPAAWWDGAHSFSGDAANLTLQPSAGGCFCETLPAGEGRAVEGSVRHMEVLLADPGTALRMSGALGPLQGEPVGAVMTITLSPMDGGTKIAVEYVVGGAMRFSQDEIGAAVDAVIGGQLSRLSRAIGALETGTEAIEIPPSSAAGDAFKAGPDQEPGDAGGFGEDFLDGVEPGTR